MLIIPVIEAEFSASLLQSSVSHDLQKHSNILIRCSRNILIINVETSVPIHIYAETMIYYNSNAWDMCVCNLL